jgi:predicted secreted protein
MGGLVTFGITWIVIGLLVLCIGVANRRSKPRGETHTEESAPAIQPETRIVLEPAKTATVIPFPPNCQRIRVEFESYAIMAAGGRSNHVDINKPTRIICLEDQ